MEGTLVRQKILESGVSIKEAATRMEVSEQHLNSKLRKSDIGVGFLHEVAKAINKNVYYFIPEPDVPAYEQAKMFNKKSKEKNYLSQQIPLYNIEASAGLVPLFKNGNEHIVDYINIPNLPICDGAIYITGDSMYPLLKSGDIVLYKQVKDIANDIFWGEMYLISIDMDDQEFISVKYIQKSETGTDWIKLVSQNTHHQPKDIPLKRVKALAIVKASVRMNAIR